MFATRSKKQASTSGGPSSGLGTGSTGTKTSPSSKCSIVSTALRALQNDSDEELPDVEDLLGISRHGALPRRSKPQTTAPTVPRRSITTKASTSPIRKLSTTECTTHNPLRPTTAASKRTTVTGTTKPTRSTSLWSPSPEPPPERASPNTSVHQRGQVHPLLASVYHLDDLDEDQQAKDSSSASEDDEPLMATTQRRDTPRNTTITTRPATSRSRRPQPDSFVSPSSSDDQLLLPPTRALPHPQPAPAPAPVPIP